MIRMEIHGQDEVLKKLAAVSDRNARKKIMDDFGSYLVAEIQNRFETETDPDGQAWEQSTRAREEGGQTLSHSNILRQSMTYEHSASRLEVGSAMIYARIHQEGGEIKPKNASKLVFRIGGRLIFADSVTIPARPYLGFTDQDEQELAHIVHDHWEGTIQ